jgi:hypothetical protein
LSRVVLIGGTPKALVKSPRVLSDPSATVAIVEHRIGLACSRSDVSDGLRVFTVIAAEHSDEGADG